MLGHPCISRRYLSEILLAALQLTWCLTRAADPTRGVLVGRVVRGGDGGGDGGGEARHRHAPTLHVVAGVSLTKTQYYNKRALCMRAPSLQPITPIAEPTKKTPHPSSSTDSNAWQVLYNNTLALAVSPLGTWLSTGEVFDRAGWSALAASPSIQCKVGHRCSDRSPSHWPPMPTIHVRWTPRNER